MEPFTVAAVCAVSFGSIVALTSFVRSLLNGRNIRLNEKIMLKALSNEMKELENLRLQMEKAERYKAHYKILGSNKEAIAYLDNKIEEILQKKANFIERYGSYALNESKQMITHSCELLDTSAKQQLKKQFNNEMESLNSELKELQERRSSLFDANSQIENRLVNHESERNKVLDRIYLKQTGILEKLYVRTMEKGEVLTKESIKSETSIFKSIVMAPVELLKQFFSVSNKASVDQLKNEISNRKAVLEAEEDINTLSLKKVKEKDVDDELELEPEYGV